MNQKIKTALLNISKRLGPLLIRYRFAVLITFVVAYFFWPKGVPHLTTDSQPSTQNPSPETSLYDPDGENADPKWSLPAELKSEELQRFAREAEKAEADFKNADKVDGDSIDLHELLLNYELKNLLLTGVKGKGFKDQRLPLDWDAILKNDYDQFPFPESLGTISMEFVINRRFHQLRDHIITAKVTKGDLLFSDWLQSANAKRLPRLKKRFATLQILTTRVLLEYPELHRWFERFDTTVKSQPQLELAEPNP